jgi:hypothetical protein
VEVRNDTLSVSYYRWLDFERFLAITGQESKRWEMTALDEDVRRKNGLSQVTLVKKIIKKRKFGRE